MKILQVIGSLSAASGGPAEVLSQQSRQYKQRGHYVATVTLDAAGVTQVDGINSDTVRYLGPGWFKYGYSPRLVAWLRAHAPEFDVVVVHGIWNYHAYAVWRATRRTGTPYVVFLHGMLDPWFKHTYPLKHLKKWLYWPWADYRVLRDARYVLFTSAEELRLAPQSFWLYKARERLVGYGIRRPSHDAGGAKADFLAHFSALTRTRNLLFLGRLHPKKGCDLLIRSFAPAALEDARLRLVMAGPDQTGWVQALRDLAAAAGIGDRVVFTGMLTGNLKWGAFEAADAFVLPSHQENFGIAVAEALACGVPVLITDKVNIWREIRDAGAGLVEPDTQAGVDALVRNWARQPAAARSDMSKRAVACFERHFDLDTVADSLMLALEDAVEQAAPRAGRSTTAPAPQQPHLSNGGGIVNVSK